MDKPPKALPLEGICASGDSGGPLFLLDDQNVTYIAGVNSGSGELIGLGTIVLHREFLRLKQCTPMFRTIEP